MILNPAIRMRPGLSRRTLMAGGAAGLAGLAFAPPFALAAGEASTRRFRVVRDGADIGTHVLRATSTGDAVEITIDINLKVRILGITAYRYDHRNQERWSAAGLESIETKTDDDGDKHFVSARRDGDGLVVKASEFEGRVDGAILPTSYWRPESVSATRFLNSQNGKPIDVKIADKGASTAQSADGPMPAQRYVVSGDLEVELFYNAAGEWVGCAFDGSGELVTYVLENAVTDVSFVRLASLR